MNKILTNHASKNFIIWLISYFCLPFSKLFNFFKISPNVLTTFSFIFLIIGCTHLINENLLNFCLLLFVSLILDFCDGQVARISKNTNKSQLRIDHLLDIVKISIIFLSLGVLFNNINSWILIFITNSLYLFFCILHESESNNKRLNLQKKKIKPIFFSQPMYKSFIPILMQFNIHSLLLLFLILIDLNYVNLILIYYIFLFLFRIFKIINFLSKQKKI